MASRTALLTLRFVQRELQTRFAGSVLGLGWTLLGPLLMLGIYAVVFGELFRQRATDLGTDSYALFVAVALWPWMMFADAIQRGMMAIQSNANLVRKVAFPHQVLVISAVTSAFVLHLLGFIAVLAALTIAGHPVRLAGIPMAALHLVLLFGLATGLALALASMEALIRDVEMAVLPTLTLLHFMTPILYPASIIPEAYQPLLRLNPLTGLIEGVRAPLLGQIVTFDPAAASLIVPAAVLFLGAWLFGRLSPYFEDFL